MEREFITPALASKYLAMNDPDNRPMEEDRVSKYRALMESGTWKVKHMIGFSYYRKELIDGQHRMKALSTSNVVGLWFNVERNA